MSTVALGDIANWGSGGTPLRSVREYFGAGLPWLSIADLNDGLISDAKESLTPLGIEHSSAKPVPPGTLLVAMYGSIGKLGIAARELCTSQAIAFAIPDTRRVDTRYLFHFLLSERPRLQSRGRGGTQSNIGQGDLKAWQMPLPSLPEQRRIAAILDKADALRAKRRAAIAKLDELTQSIFLDMFGDPATNPKGFPIRALAEFYINTADGTKCGPFGSTLKKDEFVSNGIPVWNMDNIGADGRMIEPFRMWVKERTFARLKSYSVADGDIVISRAGTVGKMCVAVTCGLPSIISTNLIRLRLGHNLLPRYFVSLMVYCKGRVGRLKTGPDGAFTHMNTGILDKLRFPYPPLKLQQKFVGIFESIEEDKARLIAQLGKVDALFASVQHRAFHGEL